jgi:hypothetical protein
VGWLAVAAAVLLGLSCAQTSTPPSGENASSADSANDAPLPALTPADVPAPSPAWSDPVDLLQLREAYGMRADFEARCEDRDVSAKASSALVAHRFDDVVDVTGPALARCPVWIQLHLWRSAALRALGRDADADLHKRWTLGLIDTILKSGDGKTPETAYVTMSTTEEYAVLSRLGLEPKRQALTGGMRDVIDAVDESGHHVSVYFNPKWHFIRLLHQVTGK